MDFFKKIFASKSEKVEPIESASSRADEVGELSLPEEDQVALKEAIRLWIWGGFEDLEFIDEQSRDFVHPHEWNAADLKWLNSVISSQWSEKKIAEESWSAQTDWDRLAEVFERLDERKIIALHCAGYTRSDGQDDSAEEWHKRGGKDSGIIGYCFYHGQDVERVVDSGELYLGFGSFADGVDAMEVAKIIGSELQSAGFSVVLPESAETRIMIENLIWRKRSPAG